MQWKAIFFLPLARVVAATVTSASFTAAPKGASLPDVQAATGVSGTATLQVTVPRASRLLRKEGKNAQSVPTLASALASRFEKRTYQADAGVVPLWKRVRGGGTSLIELRQNEEPAPASLEDNSEPAKPELEDSDHFSGVPDVLAGAREGHLHGLLGLGDDGQAMYKTTTYPHNTSMDFLRKSHQGFCFNSFRSRSISVDRQQADYRSSQCVDKHNGYPLDQLPSASVIFVFHNEDFATLLRSVHSVLNESPPHILKEIILLDDASMPEAEKFSEEDWKRLQDPLTEYVKKLPKVRLVRLKRRRGLMLARMEGAWRAQGRALVFLDSHIEATPGWIEPLLARIHEDRRHVVMPAIDGISADDFSYLPKMGLGILGFSWTLGQEPMEGPTDDPTPIQSPIMAGGLFGADREYFLHLGGYDQGMELYGGEEMEIGFRTWMCGGNIELIPCSHVGHIFRSGRYYSGQVYRVPGELIAKNKLRAAEVWMDQYKDLVKLATMAIPDIGSVDKRKRLREKLKCKDFDWYLKTVYPRMHVPKYSAQSRKGSLENGHLHACVDSFQGTHIGDEFGAYPCHNMHGSQAVLMDDDGHIMHAETKFNGCIAMNRDGNYRFADCGQTGTKWRYNSTSHTMLEVSSGKCMSVRMESVPKSPYKLTLEECKEGDVEQKWIFKD